MGNFREISESFLETVRVGTFLVFSRKFPRKCASGYVPPNELVIEKKLCEFFRSIKKEGRYIPTRTLFRKFPGKN